MTAGDYESELKTNYRDVRKRLTATAPQAKPQTAPQPEETRMTHNLSDLNERLFAQLDRLADPAKTTEELESEIKRAEAVVSVASQIISNADTAIKAAHLVVNHGDRFKSMVPMLEGKSK